MLFKKASGLFKQLVKIRPQQLASDIPHILMSQRSKTMLKVAINKKEKHSFCNVFERKDVVAKYSRSLHQNVNTTQVSVSQDASVSTYRPMYAERFSVSRPVTEKMLTTKQRR